MEQNFAEENIQLMTTLFRTVGKFVCCKSVPKLLFMSNLPENKLNYYGN